MANIKLKNASGQEVVYNGIEKIIVKDENDNNVVYGANYLQNPLIVTNIDTPPEITDVGKFVLNTTDNCMYRIEQAGSNEWVVEGEAGLDESLNYKSVFYVNNTFYTLNYDREKTEQCKVYASTDNGQSWNFLHSFGEFKCTPITYFDGKLKTVYKESTSSRYYMYLCSSVDGVSWDRVEIMSVSNYLGNPKRIIAFDDKRVIVAENYLYKKIGSDSWSEILKYTGSKYFFSGAYGNGVLVIVGSTSYSEIGGNGIIAYSETLSSFTDVNVGTISRLNDVVYGGGKFVAVGGNGVCYYSTDGKNWTAGSGLPNIPFHSVTYGNGIYVAVGQNGLVYKSTDGITWTSMATLDTTRSYYGIATDGSKFVAVGSLGGVARTLPSSSYYYRKLRYDD